MKPVKLGNINDAPLRELANTPPIIRERKNALGGTLECYKGCNLVRYAKHPPEFKSTTNDYNEMEYLHINFGERCNIACIMCKVHDRARYVRSILSPEILIKNIDLDPFIEIVIQGGEPLFIPECMEYLEYLGKIGKKYVLLTNGLLITDEVALQLARDAMRVCISINAASKDTHERVNRGSSFDVVNANIKKLISARDRLGSDLVLHGRMTITPIAINEIPLFIRTYRELGFDRINFGYDRATVPDFLAKSPAIAEKLRLEVRDALDSVDRTQIDDFRLQQLGLLDSDD